MPYGTPDSLSEPALNGANLNIPKASQACLSCRRQKRRCDKKLPACSLCDRMSRACDYSDASPAPTAEDFNALRAKLIELEGKLSAHNIDSSSNPAYSLAGPPAHHPITHGAAPFQIAPGISSLSPSTGVAQPSPVPSYVLAPAYPIQVQNRFPPITFLDAESFQNGRIQVPSLELDIPLVSPSLPVLYGMTLICGRMSLSYLVMEPQSKHPSMSSLRQCTHGCQSSRRSVSTGTCSTRCGRLGQIWLFFSFA